jgi:autotransporter-associated beta strand protein/T5SS/PEP-CTERM-associated repeat protein
VGPDGDTNIVVANGGTVEVERDEASANATIDGESTFAILAGADSKLGQIGTLVVGNTGLGTFTVGNQAQFSNMVLQSNDSYFGYSAGAHGVLESTGGLFYTDNFYLGYGGTGTATLTSGAQLLTGPAWIGYLPDSTGTLTLNGSNWRTVGLTETDYPDATIGNEGTGELQATNSQIEVGNLILAANASSSSSVTISGGSLKSTGDIVVGLNGTASLEAIDAAIEARDFFVGRFFPGATGEAELSGGSLTLSADLHVGALGAGTFTLSNGGTIQSDIANIGFGEDAVGTVNISSGQWTNARAIFVGVQGKGTLNIEAQGVINSEGGYIGQDATGQGTVNMSGGSWTMSNTLGVGVNGEGNFHATDGAAVTSQFAQIGLQTGSVGNVQIIGASWTTTETLTIGLLANGTFQATGNSTVTAGSIELGGASGVNGSLLIENSTLITDNILPGGGSGTVDFDNATLQVLGGSSVSTILMDGFATGDVTIKSGGLTVNTNGAQAGIASGMAGSGALTKTGAGRLRLTMDNTYTGGTNIQAGVLELTGNNNLGTGNVELGTAELRAYTDSTLSGDLNGGIQLLSIAANQTGTFSAVSGQTLTLAPLDFLLVAGSTLQVGSAGNTGNVVLAPTGAAALTADSFVHVTAGTLTAGNNELGFITSMATSTTVASGATLDFQDNLSTGGIAALFGGGSVNLGTNSTTTLTVGSGNFTGLISGQGTFVKNTSGTLVLGTGGNILVDGGVSVDAGTLVVNGSIGNGLGEVEVNTGGTLAGNGLVGPVKLQGGVLAPGNSAGTLTASDLLWYAGVLKFDLGSNQANSDLLIVGSFEGFATTYAFTFLDHGWQLNTPYTLIQFAGTNILDASQFTFTNGGGFDGNFAFQGNSLQFTMTAIPEPGTATLLLLSVAAWCLLRQNSRPVPPPKFQGGITKTAALNLALKS